MNEPMIAAHELLPFKKRVLYSTVLFSLLFLTLFGMSELLASWAFIDAFSAYRARPREARRSVNRYGFIATPELTVSKPQNTIRIAFLGESSTAGTGRSNFADEDTWPWQVADMLQKGFREKHIEFINAALGGYTSFESYGRLWSRIRFFSPDIIVVYHGWNEMYYFNRVDGMTSWRMLADGSWSLDRTEQPITIYEPLSVDSVIWPSQALIRLRLYFTNPFDGEVGSVHASGTLPNQYDRRALDIWRTNLRLLRETAQVLGAQLFVAKQATLIVPELPLEEQRRCRYSLHGFDHAAHVDAFQQIYRVIDEEITADRIINVTSLSGYPEYFHDHIHPTKEGAHQIAKITSAVLLTHLKSHESR
jgi:lysophospholipase L1-like esterase